ncbi:hypothetical protein [uncultured Zoogloea sp.]|nr:hypothetical protein [uncultured Zoogloea sp.]
MRDLILSRATDTNDNYTAMCVVIIDQRDGDETTVILPGGQPLQVSDVR